MNTVLVTGAAGFIGMHACARLLARGDTVVGIDNLNTYYDPALKEARLARLLPHPDFRFERLDIADRPALPELFARVRPTRVLHLAAQAGVLSIVPERMDAEALGAALADRGIAVRAGLHCAPLAHRTAGTLDTGTVRLSFSHWNTREEVSRFLVAMGEILR